MPSDKLYETRMHKLTLFQIFLSISVLLCEFYLCIAEFASTRHPALQAGSVTQLTEVNVSASTRYPALQAGSVTQLTEVNVSIGCGTVQSVRQQQTPFPAFLSLLHVLFNLNRNYFYTRSLLRISLAFLAQPFLPCDQS
jgi:hypothetical protein